MSKKKKLIISITIVLSAVILIGGGTFAYFKFVTNSGTAQTTAGKLDIDYNISNETLEGLLVPSASRSGGVMESVTAKLNTGSISGQLNIYITPNSITGMPISALMWEVDVLDTSSNLLDHYEGDFTGATLNTPIKVVDAFTLTNNLVTFNIYVWLNGERINNDNFNNDNGFTATISADTVQITGEFDPTAATYITNLYTNAAKTTVDNGPEGEEITYNYAPSVSLMNDRLGSMSTNINGGNIRYYGANPNNYVWLGDTYTSDYTFNYNGESVTREANSKKLWRIIGIFNGKLKLIQADPLPISLSWDTSEQSVNGGNGVNEWSQADLMKLLNEGYTGTNGSLYWNKGTGNVYTGNNNTITNNISFANAGLSTAEKNLISPVTWYLGAYEPGEDTDHDGASYTNIQYASERQSSILGNICTQGDTYCNDTVTRKAIWYGKVGLMYASDYGYATDFNECSNDLYNYDAEECYSNDWLSDSSNFQWTMSPRADSGSAADAFNVTDSEGWVSGGNYIYDPGSVRPVVYLKSGVTISGGNGSESNPFEIEG